jgi:phosphopantetheinyl transferase
MVPGRAPESWTLAGHGLRLDSLPDGPGARRMLAETLAAALLGQELPWSLERTVLGCPLLKSPARGAPDMHISFSRRPGLLWAAVCALPLGLDAAGDEEFGPDYPRERVFAAGELELARPLCASAEEAMALLWTLKEAAAKALGTGFNRLEPCDIIAKELRPAGRGVDGAARTPAGLLPVRADRRDGYWLAAALWPGGPEDTDV